MGWPKGSELNAAPSVAGRYRTGQNWETPPPPFPPLLPPERETHTKRQATQHGCLASLLGDWENRIEIVYNEEKIYCTGPKRAAKAEKTPC